ncbi:hypothetical protein MPH_01981 [Macrophomina phaseolina MS6]|uniref:Uncharacterized protein n=1 Tax=Macrophomina phaseolina (strain MS6) TaxID=1126212 RepID=K2S726_MACPH|nr:hypothetical protein MPH_01981 [Macrophomina phaseolina MS6]
MKKTLQICPLRFLLNNSVTIMQVQIFHHPFPRSCSTLGQSCRCFRVWIGHATVEQFHAYPALNTQPVENGVTDLANGQISPMVLFAVEETTVSAPAHASWLVCRVVFMPRQQRFLKALSVHDLHVDNLLRINITKEPLHRFPDLRLGVGGRAGWRCRIRIYPAGDVEAVQAEAEVGSIDALHNLPALLPCVDVRTPRQCLVCEGDDRQLPRSHVRHLAQVRDDEVHVARHLVARQECRGDRDDGRVELFRQE